ncbi:MAG TPA: M23 family metallopeptidase [Tepidisphaeraceae bacterium]|nr:M23 family metallopeptidase [Tepidisphaeraceae bacterium]
MNRAALGVVAAWVACACAASAADPASTPLADRIAVARAVADRVVIDGRADDWRGLYQAAADPGRVAGPDPSRDVVAVAVAPREADVLVMIRTAGRPSAEPWSFWLLLDLAGDQLDDLQILWEGPRNVIGRPVASRPGQDVPLAGAELAVGDVVELRVPYAALAPLLPAGTDARTAKPWVRVKPRSYVARTGAFTTAPCVASYRLTAAGPAADVPQPESRDRGVPVAAPFAGRWYVTQGAHAARTHAGLWAFDLNPTDATGDAARDLAGARNEDYYGWGRDVLAAAGGRVVVARDGNPDDRPKAATAGPANQVMVDVGNGAAVQYAHLMKGSVRVKVGDVVRAGDVLGRVGNSGSAFAGPHLHFSAFSHPGGARTMPLELTGVTVGLNAAADDPWNVRHDRWAPREGYYVESAGAAGAAPLTK